MPRTRPKTTATSAWLPGTDHPATGHPVTGLATVDRPDIGLAGLNDRAADGAAATTGHPVELLLKGAARPQPTVVPPPDPARGLASFDPAASAGTSPGTSLEGGLGRSPAVWVVGVHGGAGETTVASLLPDAVGTDRRWPRSSPVPVVLVARTHDRGLSAAQHAIQTWASGGTDADVVGIVFVPDAPGRLPAVLRDRMSILTGGLPHAWVVSWSEQLRAGQPPRTDRLWRRFSVELDHVLHQRAGTALQAVSHAHTAPTAPVAAVAPLAAHEVTQ